MKIVAVMIHWMILVFCDHNVIDCVFSIPSETPNDGLLPVHVYLDGMSWKETFQVRIKLKKKKYKGQKSIQGQIMLRGKSIHILMSQKDSMYL